MSAALASDSEFGRERWRREEGGGREEGGREEGGAAERGRDNPEMSPYFDGNVSILGSLRADRKQADLREEGAVTRSV